MHTPWFSYFDINTILPTRLHNLSFHHFKDKCFMPHFIYHSLSPPVLPSCSSVLLTPRVKIVTVARLCIQDETKIRVQLSKKDAAQCRKWESATNRSLHVTTWHLSRNHKLLKQQTLDHFYCLFIKLLFLSNVKSYFWPANKNQLLRLYFSNTLL
jgi:hypothetical protein